MSCHWSCDPRWVKISGHSEQLGPCGSTSHFVNNRHSKVKTRGASCIGGFGQTDGQRKFELGIPQSRGAPYIGGATYIRDKTVCAVLKNDSNFEPTYTSSELHSGLWWDSYRPSLILSWLIGQLWNLWISFQLTTCITWQCMTLNIFNDCHSAMLIEFFEAMYFSDIAKKLGSFNSHVHDVGYGI